MLAGCRWALSVGLAGARAAGGQGRGGGCAGCRGGRAGGVLLAAAICSPSGKAAGRPGAGCRHHRGGGGARPGQRQGVEDGQKKKARAGGAVCALLLWLCFSADVVVPGRGCRPGAVVVLIGGKARALIPAHSSSPHSSSRNRSRAARFCRRMIRQSAAGRRGQILHFTLLRTPSIVATGIVAAPVTPYNPPSSPDSAGVNPSRAILSAQACKI